MLVVDVVADQKDGSQRPVMNLKPLNTFVQKAYFKMEGVHMVKELLRKDDWMVSIDLKDAYLSVPVAPVHRKYLRFKWKVRSTNSNAFSLA